MGDITGQDVLNAYERAMDNAAPIMTRVLSVIVNEVSFNPTGNLAGYITTIRNGDTIESYSSLHYWQWWLNGRGAVTPKNAKALRFFGGGGIVFTAYSKPFKGHRDTVEPKYAEHLVKVLDGELTRSFGNL